MAVNGGGGVTLQFQRSPLKALTRTTFLPWNQIVIIKPVVMTPFGGAGIGWDEEDTSLKVNSIAISYEILLAKRSSFKLMVNTIIFAGQIFQAVLRSQLRAH